MPTKEISPEQHKALYEWVEKKAGIRLLPAKDKMNDVSISVSLVEEEPVIVYSRLDPRKGWEVITRTLIYSPRIDEELTKEGIATSPDIEPK